MALLMCLRDCFAASDLALESRSWSGGVAGIWREQRREQNDLEVTEVTHIKWHEILGTSAGFWLGGQCRLAA